LPLISVLLPVYNDARYVCASIESILRQTLPDFELVVINDGSTDDTPELVNQYQDPRIRLIHNERNLGLSPSLNRAIVAARGKYLARQDADDVALPHRFETQLRFLEAHPEISMLGSHACVIDDQGIETETWSYPPPDDINIKWNLLFRNPFIHSSVMMRRSVLDQTGFYAEDPDRALVEDYDLWSRINRVAKSANIEEPLQKYRLNPTSVSVRTRSEQNRQCAAISQRNICWLLGWERMDPELWDGFVGTVFGSYSSVTGPQQRRVLAFIQKLHPAFCQRFIPSRQQAKLHRYQVYQFFSHRVLHYSRSVGSKEFALRTALVASAVELRLKSYWPRVSTAQPNAFQINRS